MDEISKEYLIDFYSSGLKHYGPSPEALRWTRRGQKARYSWLLEILSPQAGESLLDYGCGLGDLGGFIKDKGLEIRYTGTDINPELIEYAKLNYKWAEFRVLDVEDSPLEAAAMYDMTALCGVFNTRVEGATESMKNVLRLLYPHTRRVLAATFMAYPIHGRQHDMNYMDPEDVLAYARDNINPDAELTTKKGIEDITLVIHK